MGRCGADSDAEKRGLFVCIGSKAKLGSDSAIFFQDAGGGHDVNPAEWAGSGRGDAAFAGRKVDRITEDAGP